MKVAIPTNDQVHIFERTGRAAGFLLVDIENGAVTAQKYIDNPHKHDDHEEEDHEHEHGHNHHELMEVLEGCSFLVGLRVGKHMRGDLDEAKITFWKSADKTIEQALTAFIAAH